MHAKYYTEGVLWNMQVLYKKHIKRLLDILLSLAAMPFLGLFFAVVAPAIKYSDHGPIFYNAPRLGYKGKTFKMFKFRSMAVNAPDIRLVDGSTYNGDDDPRQTRIGRLLRKTSLDEMPQVLNVLLGDMSIVGPRPDLPEHIKQYVGDEFEKLNVRPGMTGYNQAYFRNTIEWKERLKNDVYYARNLGFMLDVKIFLHTVYSVLCWKNVYVAESASDSENSSIVEGSVPMLDSTIAVNVQTVQSCNIATVQTINTTQIEEIKVGGVKENG